MTTIEFNGEARSIDAGTRLDELVAARPGLAVAVNGEVVPAAAWSTVTLLDGDVVDVVAAQQGG